MKQPDGLRVLWNADIRNQLHVSSQGMHQYKHPHNSHLYPGIDHVSDDQSQHAKHISVASQDPLQIVMPVMQRSVGYSLLLRVRIWHNIPRYKITTNQLSSSIDNDRTPMCYKTTTNYQPPSTTLELPLLYVITCNYM